MKEKFERDRLGRRINPPNIPIVFAIIAVLGVEEATRRVLHAIKLLEDA